MFHQRQVCFAVIQQKDSSVCRVIVITRQQFADNDPQLCQQPNIAASIAAGPLANSELNLKTRASESNAAGSSLPRLGLRPTGSRRLLYRLYSSPPLTPSRRRR